MTYFLSAERRTKLAAELREMDVSPNGIKDFTEMPDDLQEVDLCMTAHALACIHFKNKHNSGDPEASDQLKIGVYCLIALMAECDERGLSERDLPNSTMRMKEYNHRVERRNLQ